MNTESLNPSLTVAQNNSGKLVGSKVAGRTVPSSGLVPQTSLLVARAGTRRFAVMPQVGENQTALQMRKPKKNQAAIQPEPLTPGITKCMVRKHAEQLCRQRLLDHRPLAFEDWVLAEQDLSKELQK